MKVDVKAHKKRNNTKQQNQQKRQKM